MKSSARAVSRTYGGLTPRLFCSYILFLVAYALLVLLPAPQAAVLKHYGVSVTGVRIIDVTVIVVLAVIWFAGFFGYSQLHRYSQLIRRDKDGRQLYAVTRGVGLVVMWLPVSSTVSALLNLIAGRHPGALAATTIVDNYVNLLIPLIGFVLIGYGAHGLGNLVRTRASYSYTIIPALALLMTYIGTVYFHLVVSTGQRALIYHLSFWLISLTIVAPYVFMWAVGFIAVLEIYNYQRRIEGLVYKRSLTSLALGLGWLILTSILFQYLTTLVGRLSHLSIYVLLVIVYALLLILSFGFVLIALGAKKLQQIEEL